MKYFRVLYKFIGFLYLVVGFFVTAQIIRKRNPSLEVRRKKLTRLISRYSKITLKMMNVKAYVKNLVDERVQKPCLIASNHLSYLDILLLASKHPGAFVTSVEVREMPFLGILSELGGCLYVERRSRKDLSKEVQDITESLNAGLSVIFFPEATSTNAESVLRFKRPLFQSAIDAKVPVWPMTVNYFSVDDQEFTIENRDHICWYDDMPFLSHLLNLFAQREVTALITQHQQLKTENRNCSQLAELSHHLVSSRFYGYRAKIPFTAESSSSFSATLTFDSMESTSSF